jgi:hypothetical protein
MVWRNGWKKVVLSGRHRHPILTSQTRWCEKEVDFTSKLHSDCAPAAIASHLFLIAMTLRAIAFALSVDGASWVRATQPIEPRSCA